MRYLIVYMVMFAVMVSCLPALAQVVSNPNECDSITAHLVSSWKSPKLSLVKKFLATFADPSCQDNAEYSEGANEILFHLIDEHPNTCFTALFSLSKRQIQAVANEVLNPINDSIPVDQIYERLKRDRHSSDLISRALRFMKPSYDKQVEGIRNWEKVNNQKWSYPNWRPL